MAENQGGAQNKLGQLYVEFGSTGLGKLVRGLSDISARFSIAKHTAEAFTKPLINTAKQASDSAVNIGKMSKALSVSYKDFQKIQLYLKTKNVDEGLLNDIANLEKTFWDFHHGRSGMPSDMAAAFSILGLNYADYAGDFESILRLWDDIEKRMDEKNYDRNNRNMIYRMFQMSPEWGYLRERGDFNLRDAQLISDKQIEDLIAAKEAVNEFGASIELLKTRLVAKGAPGFKGLVEDHTDTLLAISDEDNKQEQKRGWTKVSRGIANFLDKPFKILSGDMTGKMPTLPELIFYRMFSKNEGQQPNINSGLNTPVSELKFGNPIPLKEISPLDAPDLYSEPSFSEDNSYTVGPLPQGAQEININYQTDMKVISNDPMQAGNQIKEIQVNQIERGVYQATNMAGR